MATLQETQKFPPLHFLPGSLQQKSAAPARPYQGIDFPEKIAGY
jgi:hypothetical protein